MRPPVATISRYSLSLSRQKRTDSVCLIFAKLKAFMMLTSILLEWIVKGHPKPDHQTKWGWNLLETRINKQIYSRGTTIKYKCNAIALCMCGLQRPESWTHFTDIETLIGTAHICYMTSLQRSSKTRSKNLQLETKGRSLNTWDHHLKYTAEGGVKWHNKVNLVAIKATLDNCPYVAMY